VLATRLAYSPDQLDALAASGEVVWIGRGPLGGRDGRVALYLRDQVPTLLTDTGVDRPDGDLHERIRDHLKSRGASFFRDLYTAAGGGDPDTVLEALWDLVWSGEVTNDTVAPLRAFLWGRVRRDPARRPALPASAPPAGSGRWYLTTDLMTPRTPTEIASARVDQLLARHGVVVRDAVLAEGMPGGFSGAYPVFTLLEDLGRVRRGYFVEGLGGTQFALPGAVDRLRLAVEDPSPVVVLAAADPANPLGTALPWPADAGRATRSAGSHVVFVAGRPTAFVERSGRSVRCLVTDPGDLEATAAALVSLGSRLPRRMVIGAIDGAGPATTALGKILLARGFADSYRGLAAPAR
jgi:ATP-dependent helicase Lhr and Lhr-like helicase